MQASADFVRTPNLLVRSLFPLEATPGLISLLAGKPNPSTFPFTSLSFTARSPTDPSKESEIKVDSGALAAGLQYGATSGYPQLCEWVYGLQEIMHGRKRGEGWHLSIGSGSQDLIFKVCPLSLSRFATLSHVILIPLPGCPMHGQPRGFCPGGITSLCVRFSPTRDYLLCPPRANPLCT